MSASSVRRLRERPCAGTGAGAKVAALKPSKTLTPNSVSDKNPVNSFKNSWTGKENPRPTSRVPAMSQKPTIRPMPRVDKAAFGPVSAGERPVRWSTSSVPRGRSSSPSEIFRVCSDIKRDRRVSVDRGPVGSGIKVLENSKQKKGYRDLNVKGSEGDVSNLRALRDCKENVKFGANLEKNSRISEELGVKEAKFEKNSGFRFSGSCNGEVKLSSNLGKLSEIDNVSGGLENHNGNGNVNLDVKVRSTTKVSMECKEKLDSVVEKTENVVDLDLGEKSSNDEKKFEILKDNGVSEEGIGGGGSIKYPSRLHEKLAFLEGKVKRIASDIKRTKEMLDMSNPDASKVILSDIQDKISGIEKAIINDVGDYEGKIGRSKSNGKDDQESQMVEKSESNEVGNVKISVKGLNREELEARLFPHHRLLRNRVSMKASSGSSKIHESHDAESSCELKVEEKLLSPIDENPIALEFLASLSKEQSKVTARDGKSGMEICEVQETDGSATSAAQDSLNVVNEKRSVEIILTTDETLDDFDDQENRKEAIIGEEIEDTYMYQLNEMGRKASTGGWFVSEGEAVLLAHDNGCCSFYDIANHEEKAEYKPPAGVSPNMWRDCWVIRAPSADGCSGRYVVAASAGNTMDSGFCSWDFYTKDVRAFHMEGGRTASRTVLGPLHNNTTHRRNALSNILVPENRQWWYRPCGPLISSTATSQRVVKIYDIRDGEEIMKWEVQKPVLTMDYSSPLQWRNRGKIVVAESETISLWDVNALNPEALLSVSSSGRKVLALHVSNTDAEIGGGVRQRVSSSEAEGNDGVFCTPDSINVMDFRHPSGVGLKIPKHGVDVQSLFSRGDSVFLGCTNVRSAGNKQSCSLVQQFSLRKQRLFSSYVLPESNAHSHHSAITQVWGNSNLVMAVCGLGLFVFDALKDNGLQSFTVDYGSTQKARETIGPDDLYSPSFDYLASRALLISRDRPAMWRHLP